MSAQAEPDDEPRLRDRLTSWLTFTLLFAILPLTLSYFALPPDKGFLAVFERGDAFVIAAALVAPEIVELQFKRPRNTPVLSCLFAFVFAAAFLFSVASTNYIATHPEAPAQTVGAPATQPNVAATSVTPTPARVRPPYEKFPRGGLFPMIFLVVGVSLSVFSIVIRSRRPSPEPSPKEEEVDRD